MQMVVVLDAWGLTCDGKGKRSRENGEGEINGDGKSKEEKMK